MTRHRGATCDVSDYRLHLFLLLYKALFCSELKPSSPLGALERPQSSSVVSSHWHVSARCVNLGNVGDTGSQHRGRGVVMQKGVASSTGRPRGSGLSRLWNWNFWNFRCKICL